MAAFKIKLIFRVKTNNRIIAIILGGHYIQQDVKVQSLDLKALSKMGRREIG